MANFANYGNLESILTGYANKINGISEVVPSDATTSNKLATEGDLPSVATSSVAGLVMPDETTTTVDENGVLSVIGGGSSDPYDGRKVRYTISSSNWSSSPNSDGYYTYSLTLTNPLSTSTSPNVYIAGSSDNTQPTATESTMFSYVKRCNLSSSTTLVLYASTKPTSTFYVFVGAEGGNIKYTDIYLGNLSNLTWTASGGGKYYTVIQNVIPSGAVMINVIICDWSNISVNHEFMFSPSSSNTRNLAVLSNVNTFNNLEFLTVRVSYI